MVELLHTIAVTIKTDIQSITVKKFEILQQPTEALGNNQRNVGSTIPESHKSIALPKTRAAITTNNAGEGSNISLWVKEKRKLKQNNADETHLIKEKKTLNQSYTLEK